MKKFLLTGALGLLSLFGKSQFTPDDLVYYVGEGPDTAVLVIDFLDDTPDSSYAWGYLFDASATVTGGDMLAAIAADEPQLDVATAGGFLTDITYNAHSGIGGDPNYWGTWSKTAATEWGMNDGLSEELANGDWFGCSYTDFDPAVAPGEPLPAYQSTKFTNEDVQFWIGTGEDSAVFVVDFVTATYGEAVTYAWGYAFDGTTTGADMIAAIDEADINLEVSATAFLNDVLFNGLEGIGGDPNYWGTWSGTNLTDWTMNAGLSTEVADGDWFGCSYAAWPPRRPFNPIAALNPEGFTAADVDFEVGSGDNQVIVVIDFNEWLPGQSYAFGYSFDSETVTAADVLSAINDFEPYAIDIAVAGGFLNDIVYYNGESGIGGSPYYWSTWSADNVGGWELNAGISTEMADGDWFACTYSSWSPATPPSMPTAGINTSGIAANETAFIQLYPNPAQNQVVIEVAENATIQLFDMSGALVLVEQVVAGANTLDIANLEAGMYWVALNTSTQSATQKLIVR